jgi:beta-lactamase superfamily II metal-dependent hydrolase
MDAIVKERGYGFAGYPSVKMYNYKLDKKSGKKKFGFVNELIFGDYIRVEKVDNEPVTITEKGKTYIKVRSRSNGYIRPEDILPDRILEVNFIDVGQGDGCHIVTPDDKHFIIDAGAGDNMYRFLAWRFNLRNGKVKPPPFTAVISHSDSDHYKGFGKVFAPGQGVNQRLEFEKIYHNGLVETSGTTLNSLGKVTADGKFITDLCDTHEQFTDRANASKKPGSYIETLLKSAAPKESLRYGHPPIYQKGNLTIEVAGPYSMTSNGESRLPVFQDNKGKTKNGNSILLRLCIGHLKILLGGDLNAMAEDYLLGCYSGINVAGIRADLAKKDLTESRRNELKRSLESAIEKSKPFVGADVAKSCHHGSPDFTCEFLRAINAYATVISSGDEESYCHPRPETLGTIGKFSSGERPLVFSTELARSSKEFIEVEKFSAAKIKERTVTVYGMINVRSDGNRVVFAQKLEKKAAARCWDIHCLEWNDRASRFEVPK